MKRIDTSDTSCYWGKFYEKWNGETISKEDIPAMVSELSRVYGVLPLGRGLSVEKRSEDDPIVLVIPKIPSMDLTFPLIVFN